MAKRETADSSESDSDSLPRLTPTPEPSTDPEPATEADPVSSDEELPQIFAPDSNRERKVGEFQVLGVFSGKTRNKVINQMVDYGAVVTLRKTSGRTTHVVMSDSVWHNHPSSEAIRHYIKNNKEDAQEYSDDPDRHRVWFLPLAWITKSIEAKKLVPEEDYDFEKLEHVRRQDRAEVLSEERRQHGGKSIYARGERAILERQRKEQELDRQLAQENAQDDLTADSSASSPVQSDRPGNPLFGYRNNPNIQKQSTINQAFLNGLRGGAQTMGGALAGPSGAWPTAGGAHGAWSGIRSQVARPAGSNSYRPQLGWPGSNEGAVPRPAPAPAPQPGSLGAIDLTSGEDSSDLSVMSPPPLKKQRVYSETVSRLDSAREPVEEDDYDW